VSETERETPEALLARLREASAASDQGDWAGALEILLKEEMEHPSEPTLLCMAGVALRETGAEDLAYDYFRRCIAQDPSDPYVLVTAGVELARWDDPDAERVLRLAALSAPGLPLARLQYGSYLAREGHLETALAELRAARDLDPYDFAVRLELGIALLLAGTATAAAGLEELEEALSLDSEDDWTRAVYGLALVNADQLEEAAEQLRSASGTRLHDWEVHAAASLAAAAVGWDEEAWSALARADLVDDADRSLLRDVEELLETGADAAVEFLVDEYAPSILRERLADR
jgi:tetratricopeptide (TPR) repeat protein